VLESRVFSGSFITRFEVVLLADGLLIPLPHAVLAADLLTALDGAEESKLSEIDDLPAAAACGRINS
jgi:hypothetical protein